MKKNHFADINSEVVLEKYIHNKPPQRRELYHWLVDLPFLVETSRGVDDELHSFANFYLETAMPFINKALKKKYGMKDAVHFINYNVMNVIHGDKKLSVEMDNVIKMEERNFKEVLKFLKKDGRFH